MTRARGILRTYPGGAPATGLTVSIKRESDDVELATDTTDAEGGWDYVANGSPGPWRWEGTDTSTDPDALRAGSTRAAGSGGAYSLYELVYALRALGNGVISGYLNGLEVTYDAAGLDLDVNTGGAVVKGIPVVFSAVTDHAVATARDATNPKACYLVLRVTGAGEAEEGKAVIADTCGTAAATPALPALTQTEALYELPLATFTLPTTASTTLTSVADVRTYLMTRNPVVSSVVRRTDPASEETTNSTTGADATSLTTTVTLLSGVIYDIEARAVLAAKVTAGQTFSLSAYINGTANLATYVGSTATDFTSIANAYTLEGVTGTGAAINCGARVKVTGGTGTYQAGYLAVIARPRS